MIREEKAQAHQDEEEMYARCMFDSELGRHKAESRSGREGLYAWASREFGISENLAEKIYQKYRLGLEIDAELKNEQLFECGNAADQDGQYS